jgi:hypothetical protein
VLVEFKKESDGFFSPALALVGLELSGRGYHQIMGLAAG